MSLPDPAAPERPNITPAQVIGLFIAGIPAIAKFAAALGIFTLSLAQQAALGDVLQWAALAAGALFVSDAGLRAARNQAVAKVQAATLAPPPVANTVNSLEGPPVEGDALLDEEVVALANQGSEPSVRQPSQDEPTPSEP